jgi:hypothetical protein
MANSTTKIVLDLKRLDRIELETPGRADQIVAKIAYDLQADAQDNMNTVSPSPEGEPPGVVTGFLKNSILGSRIKWLLWQVVVMAAYGLHLEYGTAHMAARPFFRPAINRMAARIPAYFKALIK